MTAPAHILSKVKFLLNLKQSSNVNEAENAATMAQKLIDKYQISPEELEAVEAKTFYGENEKIFSTIGICSWKRQLSLIIANHLECHIVQEEVVAPDTDQEHQFDYFVYGEGYQVGACKYAFAAFTTAINQLIIDNCPGRGPIFIESYTEGIIDGIRDNIAIHGLDIPKYNKPVEQAPVDAPKDALVKPKVEKEQPTQEKTKVYSSADLIKDVNAYFKGLYDAKDISLDEILELPNDEHKQLDQVSD